MLGQATKVCTSHLRGRVAQSRMGQSIRAIASYCTSYMHEKSFFLFCLTEDCCYNKNRQKSICFITRITRLTACQPSSTIFRNFVTLLVYACIPEIFASRFGTVFCTLKTSKSSLRQENTYGFQAAPGHFLPICNRPSFSTSFGRSKHWQLGGFSSLPTSDCFRKLTQLPMESNWNL